MISARELPVVVTLLAGIVVIAFEQREIEAGRARLDELRQLSRQGIHRLAVVRQQRDGAKSPADSRVHPGVSAPAKSPGEDALGSEMNRWLDRVADLKNLSEQRRDLVVPEFAFLSDNDWFDAARTMKIESEEQLRDKFAELRRTAESKFGEKLRGALRAYLDAHGGTAPTTTAELATYFAPQIEASILQRYTIDVNAGRGEPFIQQQSPVDFTRDTVWAIGPNGGSSQSALGWYVRRAMAEFAKANQGVRPTRPEELQPYLPGAVEATKLQPYLNPPHR